MSKKLIYFILLLLLFQPIIKTSQARAAEPDSTGDRLDPAILEEALVLVEIYYKVKRLADENKGSELKPYLDQLNAALDRAIRFKESFTPKKQAALVKQLEILKAETAKLADIPPSKMKSHLPKLTNSLWQLVQILIQ